MNTKKQTELNFKKEAEFIGLLKNHDENAFKLFVETHQDKVYNLSLGFLKNEEDAEDISQEVFIEVYDSVKNFKGESSLSTWVYRITVNKSIEFIRKMERKKRLGWLTSIFGNEDVVGNKYADFVHPGVALENKERAKILFKHINFLPENQKIAFTLHKIEGLSYRKIGDIMQLSIAAIESLLFRARKNLQKSLGEYYSNI